MSEPQQDTPAEAAKDIQPVFYIEKIYIKDLSLEVPHAPAIFTQEVQPEIDLQLSTECKQINEGIFECVLRLTTTAKAADQVLFLVEVAQAGIFQIRHIQKNDLDPLLGIACPNTLFPYARETISNMAVRAGFPPVLLAPISFEALYMQHTGQQVGHA